MKRTVQTLLSGRKAWAWLFLVTLLASCDSAGDYFRLEGRFRNLNQGEFYIYHPDEGWKDTISVRDGRFAYEKMLKDTTTLCLMFPNYSELPVFAQQGATVKITGDASHLRETEVSGTDDNEEMTGFRLRASKMTPPEVVAAAEKHIRENPSSLVSVYLLRHFFLEVAQPDYQKAAQLCDILQEAHKEGDSPVSGMLIRLRKQLDVLKAAPVNSRIPVFSVTDTDGKKVGNAQLKADINVILVWASWDSESRSVVSKVQNLVKKNDKKIAVVSIGMDANTKEFQRTFRRDSITWPNINDGQMWQSPLVRKLGFASLPANMIADKNGKILARNLPDAKAVETKIESLLKSETGR